MSVQPTDSTKKYRVRNTRSGWRIESGEARLGVYASALDAIDQACRHARADADRGHVAMVTAETIPQEFHCYVPPPDMEAPALTRTMPPYLRLLVSR